jgi:hypothetical protein
MRICSILTSFGSGGAETLVINLSREYVAAGHDAQVLVLSDADAIGTSTEFERFRGCADLACPKESAKLVGW